MSKFRYIFTLSTTNKYFLNNFFKHQNIKIMTTKKWLLDELKDIAPSGNYNATLEETLDEMPQFLMHYLSEMKNTMIKRYPNRAEIISKSYDLVITDMYDEKTWIND